MDLSIENKKIPLLLCIDVEPDLFQVNRNKKEPWLGFEKCFELFSELRPALKKATGSPVHFNWFYRMDPQIAETYGTATWAVNHYRAIADELLSQDDEIGIHPHAFRWNDRKQIWYSDHASQSWVDHCVRQSVFAFKAAFGFDCQSHRFGARWINTPTLNLLKELGIRYDLTLEPGAPYQPAQAYDHVRSNTPFPDYRNVPRYPYYPSQSDFCIAGLGNQELLEIPITSGYIQFKYGKTEEMLNRWFHPERLGLIHQVLNVGNKPRYFKESLEYAIENDDAGYLAFVMRTEVAIDPVRSRNFEQNMKYLMDHRLISDLHFMRPDEAKSVIHEEKTAGAAV